MTKGGLTVCLDLLRKNLPLSLCGAAIGILTPIGFCYLLMYLGFGYGESRGPPTSYTSVG